MFHTSLTACPFFVEKSSFAALRYNNESDTLATRLHMPHLATQAELLAPAGDWESLRAAVANGADAVYFGLTSFNARARATNFTLEELPAVMEYLHLRNVRGFVTLNILIFSDELPQVVSFVQEIASCGVDAVIVQDLGLARLIKGLAPSLHIHASTQMTLTEPRGIEFVRQLGVERVVLARELSLADIQKVTSQTTMPVEVFIHGALCVAYSGQCLTSEALGGRSANRGQCAQACRLPYEMIVDGEVRDLGDKAYLLSPQDLAGYDLVQPLIQAGVISFKIEGRLKGGPYVASTTQTYRKAIDAAITEQEFHLSRREELELAQTFSRGLTNGFLDGVNHQKLVRGRFPKSRGIRVGRVTGFSRRGIRVELAEPFPDLVKPGDGVLFDLGKPAEQEPAGRIWQVFQLLSGQVEIAFAEGALDYEDIPIGCDIWKTDDPALRKKLEQSYAQDKPARRQTVDMTLTGTIGEAVTLTVSSRCHTSASASWSGPLELAKKRATTPEEVREQLSRLGDTPFELGEVKFDLPEQVMLPKSVLNELRRQASADLWQQIQVKQTHSIVEGDALSRLRTEAKTRQPHDSPSHPQLTVMVRNLEQLDAVLAWKPTDERMRPAVIYCDFEDLRRYKDAVPKARDAGIPIGVATLRVWKPGEDGFQSMVVRAEPDIVLVRNLASISYFQEQLPKATLIGDFSLNIANELTADILWRAGLRRLVPSYDLNWDQFQSLMKQSHPGGFEVVVHQHMPMFHMEHCVFAAFLSSGKDFRDCGRPCETHKVELRDRVGANFPVLPDTGCRNTVFNSVAQSAAEYMVRMKQLGVSWYRIDLVRETPEQIGSLLQQYGEVMLGANDGHDTWKQLKVLSQLGVTRGTLNLL
jgi:U32 family peptidase